MLVYNLYGDFAQNLFNNSVNNNDKTWAKLIFPYV